MQIDNGKWHARVGIFYSWKPLLKTKSKNKEILPFLLYHTIYFLLPFLTYFVTTQQNHFQCVFKNSTKIPISQSLYLLKIANLICFPCFFSKFTLSVWGYWEKSWFQAFISKFLPLEFKWDYSSWLKPLWYKLILPMKTNLTFLNSSIQNDDHKLKIKSLSLCLS